MPPCHEYAWPEPQLAQISLFSMEPYQITATKDLAPWKYCTSLLWHSAGSEINTSFIFCPWYNTMPAVILLLSACLMQQYYATEAYFHLPESTHFSKQFSKTFYLFHALFNILPVSPHKQVCPIKGSRGLKPDPALFSS